MSLALRLRMQSMAKVTVFGWALWVGLVGCAGSTEQDPGGAGGSGSAGASAGGQTGTGSASGAGGASAGGATNAGGASGGTTSSGGASSGGASSSGGSPGAGGDPGADACVTCVESGCGAELSACDANPECVAMQTCYDGCNDDACFQKCYGDHPTAQALDDAVFDCVMNKCATPCQ